MKRRKFLTSLGSSLALTSLLGNSSSLSAKEKTEYQWKMVTSWPKNFPGLGTGAENLAQLITNLSNNRIKVKVFGANELVPPLEVFDFVSKGGAELGHSGAYYWKGKSQACQFFSSVPFGMNSQEMNAWLYYGDGIKLWEKLYDKFNLIPRPAGNTGVQMGGWFNKKINSLFLKASELNNNSLLIIKTKECLIIDEYQNNVEEKLFYSVLNQCLLSNKYIIINSVKPIQSFEIKLKDLKSRFDTFINIGINLPTDELIKVIISKNFSDKQVKIDTKLLEYILKNIDRSYEGIFDLIDKLDNLSLSTGKSININLIKKVLNK